MTTETGLAESLYPDGATLCTPGNFLFFGCRKRDQDFYWQTEWQELEKKGSLTLVTAFSREQVSILELGGAGVGMAGTQPATPAGAEGVCAASAARAGATCLGAAGSPRCPLLPSRVSQLGGVEERTSLQRWGVGVGTTGSLSFLRPTPPAMLSICLRTLRKP